MFGLGVDASPVDEKATKLSYATCIYQCPMHALSKTL